MERSAESYLHKKFKKQLSIDPRPSPQHNETEIKNAATNVESSEEKNAVSATTFPEAGDNQSRTDNNDNVPNQSTNQSGPIALLNANFSQSSISVEKCIANLQSPNLCISYVVASSQDIAEQFRPLSFDSRKTEPTSSSASTSSSILNNVYTKPSYVTKSEDISSSNIQDHSSEEVAEHKKLDDAQTLPDKGSGGKYVCTYCNLVCSKPSVLQKHIRAHTNERPFPCNSCGFSFKTRSNLYKHCRSRTHANRVMGNKAQEMNNDMVELSTNEQNSPQGSDYNVDDKVDKNQQDLKTKPYKPRFHTTKQFFNSVIKENIQDEADEVYSNKSATSDILSHHINEIISKNNSIVNSSDPYLLKRRSGDADNNNELVYRQRSELYSANMTEEPLNLTKNRKRCMSEVVEPVVQKSLIKELLLKNLNSDMQCPHCKMIFQTVTELELHKLRSCKGFVKSGAKYSRSSSVNVASILTQNKNAFDNIPHMKNAIFPLKSPGPFLGKTRLVESDKSKSFSFDDNLPFSISNEKILLSPLTLHDREKKTPVKMFGGEVKITHTTGETKSFKIDHKDGGDRNFIDYGGKVSENRVVKSGLQSGGTVLTNKTNYSKSDTITASQDVIRIYETTSVSPSIDISNFNKTKFNFDKKPQAISEVTDKFVPDVSQARSDTSTFNSPSYSYTNIMDFSQKAVKLLTPNIKQPSLVIPGVPIPTIPNKSAFRDFSNENGDKMEFECAKTEAQKVSTPTNFFNPMNLLVNGKIVRYVPGIPGPVAAAEEPADMPYGSQIVSTHRSPPAKKPPPLVKDNNLKGAGLSSSPSKLETLEIKTDFSPLKLTNTSKSPSKPGEIVETKKFARPNSLALKPTTASLKQHHGLTPTMFNQILISPDTPRVAKKYVQQFLHGNYFSYLGLKCSTKPVYCTLNKTQPFYVPHFKKLSMYSEWRQQDTKTDRLYVSAYDSRQKHQRYTTAGKTTADLVVHSSYKFVVSESSGKSERNEELQRGGTILGGYECNDDYTYIRGRGRGRFVCDQCGIRCKKPSMLKKHIRTHSNDRPYTCNHCNFSFKTKGNLTKHMKSKAHTKNYAATGSSSSSTQQSGTQSSESDTDDSGMDSSDECTRREEHEAAYGLLSLSQKTSQNMDDGDRKEVHSPTSTAHVSDVPMQLVMNTEEIAYVSKNNYAKNKILNEKNSLSFHTPKNFTDVPPTSPDSPDESENLIVFLGRAGINRPLTYPYTSVLSPESQPLVKIVEAPNKSNLAPSNVPSYENNASEVKSIKQFHVIQKYGGITPKADKVLIKETLLVTKHSDMLLNNNKIVINDVLAGTVHENSGHPLPSPVRMPQVQPPILKVNDADISNEKWDNQSATASDLRKRKFGLIDNNYKAKILRNDEVIDLSVERNSDEYNVQLHDEIPGNNYRKLTKEHRNITNEVYTVIQKNYEEIPRIQPQYNVNEDDFRINGLNYKNEYNKSPIKNNGNVLVLTTLPSDNVNINFVVQEQPPPNSDNAKTHKSVEYDNSAMETLADIATKQVKLEKNTLAKSVASEFLKIATKNDFSSSGEGGRDTGGFIPNNKEVNELIVKSEGNKNCTICSKSFSKPSQLRLHMNIHYLERPFRCHSCSVSFRTKGHLQKHERSASHHNKLSSSPALSSSEPRPFKCVDCNIAFRIHGHLAKHLRSKMHIMKLECLAKIPFGLYAELERSNSLLTEINTADGDQCLESLKTLAQKVFINDPNKLNQLHPADDKDS